MSNIKDRIDAAIERIKNMSDDDFKAEIEKIETMPVCTCDEELNAELDAVKVSSLCPECGIMTLRL